MPIDLQFDADDQAFAASVKRFCEERARAEAEGHEAGPRPVLWAGLAELGVLGLATPEGGGTAASVAAAMGQLGRYGVRGPLAGTFAATQLLPPAERKAVVAGEALVAVGSPALMPWAAVADLYIELAGDHAWLCVPLDAVEPAETLGGEPWGRCRMRRQADLGSTEVAVAHSDCALAAYLVGAAEDLLSSAAAYAAVRQQFGRPIGEFQAVSHPLADCAVSISAASALTRLAAAAICGGRGDARRSAAVARLSASAAAVGVAQQAHQTFGAMGFTVEGPVGTRSAHIRQLTLLPPSPAEVRAAVLSDLFP